MRSTENGGLKSLTAAEIRSHPEFPHVLWDLKPVQKGTVKVAKNRGGPINIAYEIHGHGEIHLVWIMGLAALKRYWQRQTKDFAHAQADRYTSLILDNRGIGESDKPFGRYTTSQMAHDLLEVLNHIDWTEKRRLHVIGISMGGMIAQELVVAFPLKTEFAAEAKVSKQALIVPERIASLTLLSTAARLVNTVSYFEHLQSRISLFIPRSLDNQLANTKCNLYTRAWLSKPDTSEYTVQPFPSNGDRFAAFELHKRLNKTDFKTSGFIGQALAAGWHYKSPEKISEIGDRVGRGRIQVIHGTADRMITFPHGETLARELGGEDSGLTVRFIKDQAHVIPAEMRSDFKGWVEEIVEKAEALNSDI